MVNVNGFGGFCSSSSSSLGDMGTSWTWGGGLAGGVGISDEANRRG